MDSDRHGAPEAMHLSWKSKRDEREPALSRYDKQLLGSVIDNIALLDFLEAFGARHMLRGCGDAHLLALDLCPYEVQGCQNLIDGA